MRVKVIRQFKDKYTEVLHETGKEYTISKERFEEINSTALGFFVKEIVRGR